MNKNALIIATDLILNREIEILKQAQEEINEYFKTCKESRYANALTLMNDVSHMQTVIWYINSADVTKED